MKAGSPAEVPSPSPFPRGERGASGPSPRGEEGEEGGKSPPGGRDALELLAEEFLARRRKGEQPTIEEYQERRPELAPEIGAVFPTLLLVEELGWSSPGGAGGRSDFTATLPGAAGEPGGLQQVGEYQIRREIGRGGMGVVYEAEQASLGRRVALKVLPFHSLLDRKRLERFHEEARAAARLTHPNIVPVFGVGEHLGLHYFVMQYIPGHGLDRIIEDVRRLREDGSSSSDSTVPRDLTSAGRSGRERYHQSAARIARDAALALDHAHREGILHRDVKPSNLLLDPTGHVWLADFGLAKSDEGDDLTRSGDIAGTARYMAPERFKGWADPRSDVYALGVTLYELLALRPAFVERDRERLIRRVTFEDPPALRHVDRAIPRDLETIVLKSIAKEPALRYASARAMADDLDRYLIGVPVEARRSTALGRFTRWCRRNRALAALGTAVFLLLLAVAAVSAHKSAQLEREWRAGREKLREARLAQARSLRSSARPGQRFGALEAIAEAVKIRPGSDLRDEAAACLALRDLRLVGSWRKEKGVRVTVDAEGRRAALRYPSGEVIVRMLEDGREVLRSPAPPARPRFVDAVFHPNGRHLAARHHDGRIDHWVVWDIEQKDLVATIDDGTGGGIDFDPRDGSVVVPTRGGTLRTVDLASGRTISETRFPVPLGNLALHPGGEFVAAVAEAPRSEVYLFERGSGRLVRSFRHPSRASHVAWHPNGRLLASACYDFKVYLWDAETGALRWSAQGRHEAPVVGVRFHPHGDLLVSESWDHKLHVWNPWSGRVLFETYGTKDGAQKEVFTRDGRQLAVQNEFHYELYELAPRPDGFLLYCDEDAGNLEPLVGAALTPDGSMVAAWGDDGVRLWHVAGREQLAHLPLPFTKFAQFDAAGAHLVTCGRTGLLRWPVRSRHAHGHRRLVLGPPEVLSPLEDLRYAAFGDGGRRIAFVHQGDHGHVISLEKPEDHVKLEEVPGLGRIAFSADGRWVAGSSGTMDKVVLWEGLQGKKAKVLETPHGFLAFDPRGRYLVVGSHEDYAFFRTGDWQLECRIERKRALPFRAPVAFDRGGEVMALTETESRIVILDVESGRRLAELEAPDPRIINGLALDQDNGYLAATTRTRRCYIWDLRGIEEKLASMGLSWDLRSRKREASERGRIHLQVIERGGLLGVEEDIEDPRSLPLFRRYRHGAFRPRLETYEDIDLALAAPRFLVPEGALWKYLPARGELSPDPDWTGLEFDDASWESGPSGLSGHANDAEAVTVLSDQAGSYTTLYARHVFDGAGIEMVEKLLLGLRFEDGFIAYLNGKEVARRSCGTAPRSPAHLALPPPADCRQEVLARLDASLLVPGKNVLAVACVTHGPESRMFLSAVLAAGLSPDTARARSRTGNIATEAGGDPDPALSAYGEGRVLERAGELDDALSAFERAVFLDPASPEPIFHRIRCHRLRGESQRAESLARETLCRGELLDDGAVWMEWFVATFHDLRRPLGEALASWPQAPAVAGGHGLLLRDLVEELAERGTVRIRCGGPPLESKDGKVWSADRFFLGGNAGGDERRRGESALTPGAPDDTIYKGHRWFPGTRQVRPGYRVPAIPGRWRVTLHFAEVYYRQPGSRVFTVLLERQPVLEHYEPLRAGFETPDVKTFEVASAGGFLDIDFLAERKEPMISAIEIERIEN